MEKLVVGPFNRGLRNERPAFMIDNESFPTLINAYQWRGRVKRKRGTEFLCRLQRFFDSTDPTFSSTVTITLSSGAANLLTDFSTLETNAEIVLGSVTIIDSTTSLTYTDDSNGNLVGNPTGSGSINYTTGAITIVGGASDTISSKFNYYPDLPVMGLEDLILSGMQFPGTLGFDTTYSYNILTAFPYTSYDVSFYKNPSTASYSSYVQKTNWTSVTWNGKDYQQFWTTNYQGALWASNGITIPFTTTNIGMQFQIPSSVTWIDATDMQFTISGSPLVVGDFVFVNEFVGSGTPDTTSQTLNFQTGYVITVAGDVYTVKFPNANISNDTYTNGMVQYLTTRVDPTIDCIRWYDGDPTSGVPSAPTFVPGDGWVNFCPPLSEFNYSINDLPLAQYYLVGARILIQFKDRLLFFGPVIQTSSGSKHYLQDVIIYSQNGTPYYTCSWAGNVFDPTTPPGFIPILCPINQTATPYSFWEDQTGFGGNISAALDKAITTVSTNEDALIVGFDQNYQTRVIYSGNDIIPFNFYLINAEMGSSSTFSVTNMDYGVITKGTRGYIVTSQTQVDRIDLEIPDEVFETQLTSNGTERVCAQRDFINEWIYFTYPVNDETGIQVYPNQTLQYNYRDKSWAIFYETYTTYGSFRKQTGFTWNTVGTIYPTWNSWNDPWDAGQSTLEQPQVIGGNQQGFVLCRAIGTGEGTSLFIQNISGVTVTSPNHCLNEGDFIIITRCIGTIANPINNFVYQIQNVNNNSFDLLNFTGSGTYLGGGLITRVYIPQIQTKQFPMAWQYGRKTRIGMQQYLLTTTSRGQITLQIFLSQNANSDYNDPSNDALVYSQVLYTCPESTNLGLTPFNVNLQTPTAIQQAQIWHRVNTSLIGDTVQLGFTKTPAQITILNTAGTPIVITGASQASECVLSVTAPFTIEAGNLVQVNNVIGMTQLNGNTYTVISTDNATEITISADSTSFTAYISGGTVTQVEYTNINDEIELHGFTMDISASQLLV